MTWTKTKYGNNVYKNEIKIRYFDSRSSIPDFYIGNKQLVPSNYKRIKDTFINMLMLGMSVIFLFFIIKGYEDKKRKKKELDEQEDIF